MRVSPRVPSWVGAPLAVVLSIAAPAVAEAGPATSAEEASVAEGTPEIEPTDGAPAPGTAPGATGPSEIDQRRAELDDVLREASRDLGLSVSHQISALASPLDEGTLVAAGEAGWAMGGELLPHGEGLLLRLSVVRPGTRVVLVGRAVVTRQTLEVRAIQLLRELVSFAPETSPSARPERHSVPAAPPEQRSSGRAVLTAHGALIGGYVGFSLEHIGGAGDARLVYPLMTLGAGAGVGASLVIAEEWDISTAEAWYVWAAGTWSTVSGMLIADATRPASESQRYGLGLLGASSGLVLGSVALNTGEVGPGGAVLTHSGALFGAFFGGLGQMLAEGSTGVRPTLGLGLGLGSGLIVSGAIAPHAGDLSSSRVLFIDVSAILGGLAGAALASPLLVGDALSRDESRIWVGSIAAGSIAGGVVGALLTTGESDPPMFGVEPYFEIVPSPKGATRGTTSLLGVQGRW